MIMGLTASQIKFFHGKDQEKKWKNLIVTLLALSLVIKVR